MRIFVDDSGDFGWAPAQISLHCGVLVSSSVLVELFPRHFEWKKSMIGLHRRREIKASSLTDEQLAAFVRTVIIPENHLRHVIVGVDTSLVTKRVFENWRDGLSHLCQGAAGWSNSRRFPIAARQYAEMGGWLWNRSPENLALMLSLGEVIWQSLQNAVIWFHEPQFEPEFDDFEIVIDRSFIRRREHELFWCEFFRTYLTNKSRREPLRVSREWNENNHIFERKYCQHDGNLDLTPLFREHMYFSDSEVSEGLQIADICAHICLRYHRRKQWFEAYRLLRKYILGPDRSPMTALVPVGELDLQFQGGHQHPARSLGLRKADETSLAQTLVSCF